MEILNLSLPATNRFASEYLEQSAAIQPFFHYRFNDSAADLTRLKELAERSFPREEVAAYIQNFMKQYPSSHAVETSIEKLKQSDSTVVIGGQQAGILTGPLYSIHKVISIIKLAEQKERQLGVPVVPVFWIAGEDHDFQEVNHVYLPAGERADKWVYPEKVLQKKMVSDIRLNKEVCLSWVQNLIKNFGETDHTNGLLDFAEKCLESSSSFVDFFANIIMELFKDYGLLIVDSGDRNFRLLQRSFFAEMIRSHSVITHSLLEQQKTIAGMGYPLTIESGEQAANIFYCDQRHNERVLLEYDQMNHRFWGKNPRVSFTLEELLEIAAMEPEKLSNNVVTRPLMQELLFPSLAFIAGPGEISYWAELKLVFEHFKIKMPPIVPRLNITLLERSIETDLAELDLKLEKVLSKGINEDRNKFLEAIKDWEINELFSDARSALLEHYGRIEAKTSSLDKGLMPLLKKNEGYLLKEISFMEYKLEESVKRQHNIVLSKYSRVGLSLRPEGFPQERMWNVFYYLNQYGPQLIDDLMELEYEFNGLHKVIRM